MNWVGGIRSRLKLQHEKKQQKEFFEKRKYISKVRRVQPYASPSRKKVSQDLQSIKTVERTHGPQNEAPSNFPKKPVVVDLDGRASLPRPQKQENLELPNMSPLETVSVLQLATASDKINGSQSTQKIEDRRTERERFPGQKCPLKENRPVWSGSLISNQGPVVYRTPFSTDSTRTKMSRTGRLFDSAPKSHRELHSLSDVESETPFLSVKPGTQVGLCTIEEEPFPPKSNSNSSLSDTVPDIKLGKRSIYTVSEDFQMTPLKKYHQPAKKHSDHTRHRKNEIPFETENPVSEKWNQRQGRSFVNVDILSKGKDKGTGHRHGRKRSPYTDTDNHSGTETAWRPLKLHERKMQKQKCCENQAKKLLKEEKDHFLQLKESGVKTQQTMKKSFCEVGDCGKKDMKDECGQRGVRDKRGDSSQVHGPIFSHSACKRTHFEGFSDIDIGGHIDTDTKDRGSKRDDESCHPFGQRGPLPPNKKTRKLLTSTPKLDFQDAESPLDDLMDDMKFNKNHPFPLYENGVLSYHKEEGDFLPETPLMPVYKERLFSLLGMSRPVAKQKDTPVIKTTDQVCSTEKTVECSQVCNDLQMKKKTQGQEIKAGTITDLSGYKDSNDLNEVDSCADDNKTSDHSLRNFIRGDTSGLQNDVVSPTVLKPRELSEPHVGDDGMEGSCCDIDPDKSFGSCSSITIVSEDQGQVVPPSVLMYQKQLDDSCTMYQPCSWNSSNASLGNKTKIPSKRNQPRSSAQEALDELLQLDEQCKDAEMDEELELEKELARELQIEETVQNSPSIDPTALEFMSAAADTGKEITKSCNRGKSMTVTVAEGSVPVAKVDMEDEDTGRNVMDHPFVHSPVSSQLDFEAMQLEYQSSLMKVTPVRKKDTHPGSKTSFDSVKIKKEELSGERASLDRFNQLNVFKDSFNADVTPGKRTDSSTGAMNSAQSDRIKNTATPVEQKVTVGIIPEDTTSPQGQCDKEIRCGMSKFDQSVPNTKDIGISCNLLVFPDQDKCIGTEPSVFNSICVQTDSVSLSDSGTNTEAPVLVSSTTQVSPISTGQDEAGGGDFEGTLRECKAPQLHDCPGPLEKVLSLSPTMTTDDAVFGAEEETSASSCMETKRHVVEDKEGLPKDSAHPVIPTSCSTEGTGEHGHDPMVDSQAEPTETECIILQNDEPGPTLSSDHSGQGLSLVIQAELKDRDSDKLQRSAAETVAKDREKVESPELNKILPLQMLSLNNDVPCTKEDVSCSASLSPQPNACHPTDVVTADPTNHPSISPMQPIHMEYDSKSLSEVLNVGEAESPHEHDEGFPTADGGMELNRKGTTPPVDPFLTYAVDSKMPSTEVKKTCSEDMLVQEMGATSGSESDRVEAAPMNQLQLHEVTEKQLIQDRSMCSFQPKGLCQDHTFQDERSGVSSQQEIPDEVQNVASSDSNDKKDVTSVCEVEIPNLDIQMVVPESPVFGVCPSPVFGKPDELFLSPVSRGYDEALLTAEDFLDETVQSPVLEDDAPMLSPYSKDDASTLSPDLRGCKPDPVLREDDQILRSNISHVSSDDQDLGLDDKTDLNSDYEQMLTQDSVELESKSSHFFDLSGQMTKPSGVLDILEENQISLTSPVLRTNEIRIISVSASPTCLDIRQGHLNDHTNSESSDIVQVMANEDMDVETQTEEGEHLAAGEVFNCEHRAVTPDLKSHGIADLDIPLGPSGDQDGRTSLGSEHMQLMEAENCSNSCVEDGQINIAKSSNDEIAPGPCGDVAKTSSLQPDATGRVATVNRRLVLNSVEKCSRTEKSLKSESTAKKSVEVLFTGESSEDVTPKGKLRLKRFTMVAEGGEDKGRTSPSGAGLSSKHRSKGRGRKKSFRLYSEGGVFGEDLPEMSNETRVSESAMSTQMSSRQNRELTEIRNEIVKIRAKNLKNAGSLNTGGSD